MNWALVAQLIVTVGIPTAEKLVQLWTSGVPVSEETFAQLRDSAKQTARDRMAAALAKAGLPLDSEQSKVLLALAS